MQAFLPSFASEYLSSSKQNDQGMLHEQTYVDFIIVINSSKKQKYVLKNVKHQLGKIFLFRWVESSGD